MHQTVIKIHITALLGIKPGIQFEVRTFCSFQTWTKRGSIVLLSCQKSVICFGRANTPIDSRGWIMKFSLLVWHSTPGLSTTITKLMIWRINKVPVSHPAASWIVACHSWSLSVPCFLVSSLLSTVSNKGIKSPKISTERRKHRLQGKKRSVFLVTSCLCSQLCLITIWGRQGCEWLQKFESEL